MLALRAMLSRGRTAATVTEVMGDFAAAIARSQDAREETSAPCSGALGVRQCETRSFASVHRLDQRVGFVLFADACPEYGCAGNHRSRKVKVSRQQRLASVRQNIT